MRVIERIWSGDSAGDRIARAVLSPLAAAFRGVVAVRTKLYDRGLLPIQQSPIPVLSIGNLTVGGTGKTPIAAWFASRLAEAGRKPAIVMRGYGGDESLVHKILNPSVTLVISRHRASGIVDASRSGADVAILDDAFQHRAASRDVDIVLISADDWTGDRRLLPAGPYREPFRSITRASMVIITRKGASAAKLAQVESAVRRTAPSVLLAVVALDLFELVAWDEPSRKFDLSVIRDKSVLAIAAIGNPDAFFTQLMSRGARVESKNFTDHHAFTAEEIAELAHRSHSFDYTICTLKDAVKLGTQWPADASPLWYVSLSVIVERGEASIDEIITRLASSTELS